MPAGYSGTPLVKKLGYKPGMRVIFLGAPDHYPKLLGKLPEDVDVRTRLTGAFDLIHFFTPKYARLEKELPRLAKALNPAGMLWISWPKKASKLEKDLSETDVRETVLRTQKHLVDVKICAVDEDWSGLKFVIRKAAR